MNLGSHESQALTSSGQTLAHASHTERSHPPTLERTSETCTSEIDASTRDHFWNTPRVEVKTESSERIQTSLTSRSHTYENTTTLASHSSAIPCTHDLSRDPKPSLGKDTRSEATHDRQRIYQACSSRHRASQRTRCAFVPRSEIYARHLPSNEVIWIESHCTRDGLSHGWLTTRRSLKAQHYYEGQTQIWVPRPQMVAHDGRLRSHVTSRPPWKQSRPSRQSLERPRPPRRGRVHPRARRTRSHVRRPTDDVLGKVKGLKIWLPKSPLSTTPQVDTQMSSHQGSIDHTSDMQLASCQPVTTEHTCEMTIDLAVEVTPRPLILGTSTYEDLGSSQPLTIRERARRLQILLYGERSLFFGRCTSDIGFAVH